MTPDQANTTVSELLPRVSEARVDEICQTYTAHHKPDQEKLALAQEVQTARRATADVTEAARLLKDYDEAVDWHSYRPHDVNREADQHKAAAKLADAVRTLLAAINPPMGR